jgi:polyribonucleotide nucleotidyltransferase
MVKEQVPIEPRVHARLIGQRGRAIHKVMEQYSVDIKFPRNTDPDPSMVTIIGSEENVADAKDYLLNQAEEYVSYQKYLQKLCTVLLIILEASLFLSC